MSVRLTAGDILHKAESGAHRASLKPKGFFKDFMEFKDFSLPLGQISLS